MLLHFRSDFLRFLDILSHFGDFSKKTGRQLICFEKLDDTEIKHCWTTATQNPVVQIYAPVNIADSIDPIHNINQHRKIRRVTENLIVALGPPSLFGGNNRRLKGVIRLRGNIKSLV